MRIAAFITGLALFWVVLRDVFNTIILARRTHSSFRITRAVYKLTWRPYSWIARRIRSGTRREGILGAYGPLALLTVFALWAISIIFAFGTLQWAARMRPTDLPTTAINDFFLSATTFFTLESGRPLNSLSRLLSAAEAGAGISLLGLVVGYLPVFYEAFSQRELQISLLDARAGSPPSAGQLLKVEVSSASRVERYLERWEKWAAETLEMQLSYPMMAWFRSHHPNQSWLTALTAMIDCTGVICLCAEGDLKVQAEFTFAMGRHALVDIASLLHVEVCPPGTDRLSGEDFALLRDTIAHARLPFHADGLTTNGLAELRDMYEPYAQGLSSFLLMALPTWQPEKGFHPNWRTDRYASDDEAFTISDPFESSSD